MKFWFNPNTGYGFRDTNVWVGDQVNENLVAWNGFVEQRWDTIGRMRPTPRMGESMYASYHPRGDP